MAAEQPWIPLNIMLSMYGSRINSKLLFRYPFERPQNDPQPLSSYKQLTSSTFHLNKKKHGSVSDDSFDHKQAVKNEREQLELFSDELLSHVLSPGNTKICGKKFDVKINGIRFVGFPLVLEQVGDILAKFDILPDNTSDPQTLKDHSNCSSNVGSQHQASTILSFSIVFVLRAVAEYSIVEKYQEFALRLGLAVRFEEKCDRYLTRETRLMLAAHDEMSLESDNISKPEEAYRWILQKSRLADQLRTIYNCLCQSGIVAVKINDSTHISFCLPHKVHNINAPNKEPIPISSVENAIKEIRPYHGILIFNKREVSSSLPDDYSPSISRLLTVYEPTKSLQRIASDADLPLTQVYRLTSHLVYWGKACVIYPLCDSNIYVLAPSAQLNMNSEISKRFEEQFTINLAEVLSNFSLPQRLSDFKMPHSMFFGNDKKLVEVVFWLLQHRFLIQMHTYIYFLPSANLQPPSSTVTQSRHAPDSSNHDLNETNSLVSILPRSQRKALLTVPAAKNIKDLRRFINLMKYFDGNHQIEEIMYNENMARPQMLTILDKFAPVLLTTMREDSTTAAFCMGFK